MAKKRPFHRTDRLGSRVREILAVALQQEAREELLRQVVITGVDVTRDLSLARVHYYPMSGDEAAIAQALERASGFLRMRVGQEIRMRITPDLRFLRDDSVDQGRRVEEILRDLALSPEADGEPTEGDAGPEDEPADADPAEGEDEG
ncbi:MAG: 30S ribosome-binding factor RbfA [Deltaproteobacteria bacterium]|nr:30S ribosome-binding factor RbfA [Deltaproteobacteria bacterium]MCB9788723.1 30S ribosome-binding factor RbfA [Deltaproteobacteria bacterium]